MKKLYGIGVGPGDKELITVKGLRLIRECDCVFIPRSKGRSLVGSIVRDYIRYKKTVYLDFTMGDENRENYRAAAISIENELGNGHKGVFLTLGDPLTYSTYIYLMEEAKKTGMEIETVPGITSFNAAASLINMPVVMRDETFCLCDRGIDREILRKADSICILKVNQSKGPIIDRLEEEGFEYAYIKRGTMSGQEILTDKERIKMDDDYMSLIIGRRK